MKPRYNRLLRSSAQTCCAYSDNKNKPDIRNQISYNLDVKETRRSIIKLAPGLLIGMASICGGSSRAQSSVDDNIAAQQRAMYEQMDAIAGKDYGKPRFKYSDFTQCESGLQYKDLREGQGDRVVQLGDTVTIDWDGYTIGYYGRPFEARNKAKGGAFTGDNKEFLRVTLGLDKLVPGVQEGLLGMRKGGLRRLVVGQELGYPENSFKSVLPRPSTFAGERALDFVLRNRGMIDKTLMFDVEIIKVDRG